MAAAVAGLLALPPSSGTTLRPADQTRPPLTASSQTYQVTDFGADPSGHNDSTLAIRQAIAVAGATPGPNTVYFPPGTYILDDNDGAVVDLRLHGPNPIIVVGAGMDSTKVIEEVGLVKYPSLSATKGVFLIATNGGSGSRITGLTVDSQTYTAGTALADFGSNTMIDHDTFLGATSNPSYNHDVFDARILGLCSKTNPHRLGGNVISDLVLNGRGVGGNVDLDLSCQINATVSNVQDTGAGLGFYLDSGVTLDGYTFTPSSAQASAKAYQVTGPSDHISLSNVVTHGNGGNLLPSQGGYRISAVTITNETMTAPGNHVALGDVSGVSISNSQLQGVYINPYVAATDITLTSSSIAGKVTCVPGSPSARITDLVGISCP
ncbi:MAG: glycoside hydrolase family 55 protein [Actinomycetota bacterium]|nr:glycoside hydrolase family 55 protein [Actinomycetota bacterium]